MYVETYYKGTDNENLKNFDKVALSGKFDKVVKTKDLKVTQHSILSDLS